MKADIIVAIQNLFGTAVHLFHAPKSTAISTLFSENGTLELPFKRIAAKGRTEIEDTVASLNKNNERDCIKEYHLIHSPAYMVYENMRNAKLTCESNSIWINERFMTIELGCVRFDVDFLLENDEWRISRLRAYPMQSFIPVAYNSGEFKRYADNANLSFPGGVAPAAGDVVEIQNLLGAWSRANRKDAGELFADSGGAALDLPRILPEAVNGYESIIGALKTLQEMEKENNYYFLAVPYLSAPVITRSGHDRAAGIWMSQTYCAVGKVHGYAGRERVVRRIERYICEFIRENGKWKILKLKTIPIVELPPEIIDHTSFAQIDPAGGNVWKYPVKEENCAHLYPYDVFLVQRFMSDWALYLRNNMALKFRENYVAKEHEFCLDIRKPHFGDEITKKLSEFDAGKVYHAPTSHNGSSPLTVISKDGLSAKVYYLDRSWTNISGMSGENGNTDEAVNYMRLMGMYRMDLCKEQGEWKLTRLEWYTLCQLEDRQMDRRASKGWAGSDMNNNWPLTFETLENK